LLVFVHEKGRHTGDHVENYTAQDPHVDLLAIVTPRVPQYIDRWEHFWRREEVVEFGNELTLPLEGTLGRLEGFLEHVYVLILQVVYMVAEKQVSEPQLLNRVLLREANRVELEAAYDHLVFVQILNRAR